MDRYTQPIWSNSVLLTIDMQEDFSRVHGASYIEETEKIIPEISKLVHYYRRKHRPIIHIVRLYNPDGSNVDICRKKSIKNGAQIVTPHSRGAELVSEIKPDKSVKLDAKLLLQSNPQKLAAKEWVIYKPRWGAFYNTGLDLFLQDLNTSTIVVSGCNFPNCPRTTIYEASERDYRTVLVKDATSGLYPKGEKELRNIGVAIYQTNEIVSDQE